MLVYEVKKTVDSLEGSNDDMHLCRDRYEVSMSEFRTAMLGRMGITIFNNRSDANRKCNELNNE